jgi:hypothetical protein
MIENGTGNTVFILRNMHGHGISMHISCSIWKCVYEHSTPESRLTNWKYLKTYINVEYNVLPVNMEVINFKQIYYINDMCKSNITKSSNKYSELWGNSIDYNTEFLPEEFLVNHKNLSYGFRKYNCMIPNDIDSKDPCSDNPEICWCDVINMLRSTGSAVTEIEMSPKTESYNQHPAVVRFSIKVDPQNPNLLNINIKFMFDDSKYKFKQHIHFRRRQNYSNNSGSDGEYDLENLYSDRTDDF